MLLVAYVSLQNDENKVLNVDLTHENLFEQCFDYL